MEEAGLELGTLYPVAESYCSPGTSTEFFYIYVGLAELPDNVTGVAGLDSEHEDIRSHLMSFDALMEMCDAQQAANAPLVLTALLVVLRLLTALASRSSAVTVSSHPMHASVMLTPYCMG